MVMQYHALRHSTLVVLSLLVIVYGTQAIVKPNCNIAASTVRLPVGQSKCKNPPMAKRKLFDDAQIASPFYVVAMTKTPETAEIDNVCYTYFENINVFLHVISTVLKNGTFTQAVLHKYDVEGRLGQAEAFGENCIYHDFTLTPLCNGTVFPLYRCYLCGGCPNLDAAPNPGQDMRIVLANHPKVSKTCKAEIKAMFQDTHILKGSEYVFLPQKEPYKCVTSFTYNALNYDKALGHISLIQFHDD